MLLLHMQLLDIEQSARIQTAVPGVLMDVHLISQLLARPIKAPRSAGNSSVSTSSHAESGRSSPECITTCQPTSAQATSQGGGAASEAHAQPAAVQHGSSSMQAAAPAHAMPGLQAPVRPDSLPDRHVPLFFLLQYGTGLRGVACQAA